MKVHKAPSMPSLFVSHGAPDLPLSDCSAREFLSQLGEQLPEPTMPKRTTLRPNIYCRSSLP